MKNQLGFLISICSLIRYLFVCKEAKSWILLESVSELGDAVSKAQSGDVIKLENRVWRIGRYFDDLRKW